MGDPNYNKQNLQEQILNVGPNSLPRINKLKIIGNGQNNWSVSSSGPFYLLEPDIGITKSTNDNSEPPLTGATNLINHFGLLSTYHKFCGKPLKSSLSSFLPNISCNIDVSADKNESGLMNLIQKPPIQKEILPLPSSTMSEVFRLHMDLMPELMYLFTPQVNNAPLPQPDQTTNGKSNTSKSHNSTESSHPRKRQRRSHIITPPQYHGQDFQSSHQIIPQNATPVDVVDSNTRQIIQSPANINPLSSQPSQVLMPASSTSTHSHNPSPLMTTVIVKPKKSKKYDDEERKRRKKEKKEKKKKKDRSVE